MILKLHEKKRLSESDKQGYNENRHGWNDWTIGLESRTGYQIVHFVLTYFGKWIEKNIYTWITYPYLLAIFFFHFLKWQQIIQMNMPCRYIWSHGAGGLVRSNRAWRWVFWQRNGLGCWWSSRSRGRRWVSWRRNGCTFSFLDNGTNFIEWICIYFHLCFLSLFSSSDK